MRVGLIVDFMDSKEHLRNKTYKLYKERSPVGRGKQQTGD